MKNLGKIFEENWKKSVPSNVFYYRVKDSNNNWARNEQLRFTPSNIADCLLFNGATLILVELKSHKGKSIPLNCIMGKKTKVKQIEDLYEAEKYDCVYSQLVVFFSDVERCFSLPIESVLWFEQLNNRKSIPIEYFEKFGEEIDVTKLQTNYRYDIDRWLLNFRSYYDENELYYE